jgi:hypothetical protein
MKIKFNGIKLQYFKPKKVEDINDFFAEDNAAWTYRSEFLTDTYSLSEKEIRELDCLVADVIHMYSDRVKEKNGKEGCYVELKEYKKKKVKKR